MSPSSSDNNLQIPLFATCSFLQCGVGLHLYWRTNELDKLLTKQSCKTARANWDVRSYQILSDLNWRSLPARDVVPNKWELLCSKQWTNNCLRIYQKRFENSNTIHRYNLHDSKLNLFIPTLNSESLKKSFCHGGAITTALHCTSLSNFLALLNL